LLFKKDGLFHVLHYGLDISKQACLELFHAELLLVVPAGCKLLPLPHENGSTFRFVTASIVADHEL
jgi:hypothetical protein